MLGRHLSAVSYRTQSEIQNPADLLDPHTQKQNDSHEQLTE